MNEKEESLYEVAGKEIINKNLKLGLWTKAYSESEGNANKAESIYIKLRVNQLKEELIYLDRYRKTLPKEQPTKKELSSIGAFRYWLQNQDKKFMHVRNDEVESLLNMYRANLF